jgi:hypothetical protein
MRTGERSKMEQRGYSITAIEPRIFGGTPILDDARLSEANARLIASAPDLLAMLERVCDALSHRLERDENSAALTDASVLIAQVKG